MVLSSRHVRGVLLNVNGLKIAYVSALSGTNYALTLMVNLYRVAIL